jgi:acetyl esterase/lipase
MRKWSTRGKWIGAVVGAGLVVVGYLAWPYGRMAYNMYFYGPPALKRFQVSPPIETVRYGNEPKQSADLRIPAGQGPFPIAVLVHGGCWDASFGGSSDLAPLADALTKQGIATLNIRYRVVGDAGGGWPGTLRDVGAAIDSVRGIASRYPIDTERLLVAGHSAGAHLALWSGMRSKLSPGSDVAVENPLKPKAVVAIDGPGSLADFIGVDTEVCGKPVIVPFVGGTPQQVPARYRDATPQDHLPLGVKQYFVQGALFDLMQPYMDRAKQAGDVTKSIRPPKGGHFRILNPNEPQGQATLALVIEAAQGMGK